MFEPFTFIFHSNARIHGRLFFKNRWKISIKRTSYFFRICRAFCFEVFLFTRQLDSSNSQIEDLLSWIKGTVVIPARSGFLVWIILDSLIVNNLLIVSSSVASILMSNILWKWKIKQTWTHNLLEYYWSRFQFLVYWIIFLE